MSEIEYNISIENCTWLVGYHQTNDALFLYKYNTDGTLTVVANGAVDAIFFPEFLGNDPWIELGAL